MAYSVLIVGGTKLAKKLAGILEGEGYKEIHLAHDCQKAVEMARLYTPEIVLMDIGLSCEEPLSAARSILADRPVPIIMLSSYDQIGHVLEADEMGVSAHMFRPITKENLLGAIKLGVSRFRMCRALQAEIGDCKEALRVRKLVERAKGILMKRNALTEEAAFLKIQKLSRDNNISMEKVAQSIITASEII